MTPTIAALILISPFVGAGLIVAGIIVHDHVLYPWRSPELRTHTDSTKQVIY